MDTEQLNALKVAELKQLLKARGLSIVGIKNDLIARLQVALQKEAATGISTLVGPTKIAENIDEDAILGGDDDGSVGKPDDSLLHNEDLLLSENNIVGTSVTKKAVSIPPKPKVAVPNSIPTSPVNNAKVAEAKKPIAVAANSVSSLKQLASSKNILTVDQRKEMRLVKFGDPKIKNRVERFGTVIEKSVAESDKLKKRMHRFGEAVSEKAKTIDIQERIEKRQERFGRVSLEPKSSNGIRQIISSSTPDIKKRQERFGVVETNKNNDSQQGFKRRRFAL